MGSIDPALPRAWRRITEDTKLLTLQRAVLECRITINQSLAIIQSTVDVNWRGVPTPIGALDR